MTRRIRSGRPDIATSTVSVWRRRSASLILGIGLALLLVLGGVALAGVHAAKPARFQLVGRANPGAGHNGDIVAHRARLPVQLGPRRACDAPSAYGSTASPTPGPPRRVSTFADGASQPRLAGSWTEKTIVRRVTTPTFPGDLAVTSVQDCRRAD